MPSPPGHGGSGGSATPKTRWIRYTGVLPVFVGRATWAVEFAERGEKEYTATPAGAVTDTQDVTALCWKSPGAGELGRAEAVLPPIHWRDPADPAHVLRAEAEKRQ